MEAVAAVSMALAAFSPTDLMWTSVATRYTQAGVHDWNQWFNGYFRHAYQWFVTVTESNAVAAVFTWGRCAVDFIGKGRPRNSVLLPSPAEYRQVF